MRHSLHRLVEPAPSALGSHAQILQLVLDNMAEGVCVADLDGRIITANPAAEAVFGPLHGVAFDERFGSSFRLDDQVTPCPPALRPMTRAIRGDSIERQSLFIAGNRSPDTSGEDQRRGTWIRLNARPLLEPDGRIVGGVLVFRDITHIKSTEDRMAYLAQFDLLTGLPNRFQFRQRLERAMAGARAGGRRLAVLFLDFDRFKEINDTLGHALGDDLLAAIARRLADSLGPAVFLSRLGGDEFTVIVEDASRDESVTAVADAVQRALAEPFPLGDNAYALSASIGGVVFPDDGEAVDDLLRKADMAMYQAKERGRSNVQFYDASMTAVAAERLFMKTMLAQALARGQFFLHYQPLVEAATGRPVGVEALLRWRCDELGLVSPAKFIPVTEETGLILPIGRWVLDTACRQARAWQEAGHPPVEIAVNLSPRQLRDPSLVDHVRSVLADTGLDPALLVLEITEGLLIEDMALSRRVLTALKGLGIRLALDDFGTGYSSLSYLNCLPFDILKMDGSFTRSLSDAEGDNAGGQAIARAIIALAGSLNMVLVAEGVETAEQRDWLTRNGCDLLQGYLLGRPADAQDVTRTLRALEREHVALEHGDFVI
ncbi:putative bifunctional diguanylate cyclase/phosphodiesterase [Azospirillum doebereinerae]|uniref:putative bifunctional diguanylate cyclase/phosphodiesterase n=1 Tax=Azospirillum doebereinerae TaxID=92933 RepID=UPI001EE58960|nr:EAL domain-containing protein [Azospirillum doebereinerae]MCG5243114.1 EAL domain-containing protein [Azospirillum doebereinerae]